MSSGLGQKRPKSGSSDSLGTGPSRENRPAAGSAHYLQPSGMSAVHHGSRKPAGLASSSSSVPFNRPILREVNHAQPLGGYKGRGPVRDPFGASSGSRSVGSSLPVSYAHFHSHTPASSARKAPSSLLCLPRATSHSAHRKQKTELQAMTGDPQAASRVASITIPSVSTSTANAPSSVASAPAASADKHKPLPMHRHMTDLDQHFLHLSENSQSAEEWEVAQITAPHLFMEGPSGEVPAPARSARRSPPTPASTGRQPPAQGTSSTTRPDLLQQVEGLSLEEIETLMERLQLRRKRILEDCAAREDTGMKVDQDVAPTSTYEPQAAVAGSSMMTIASSPRSPSSSLSSTGVKISEHEEAYNLRMKHYLGQRYPELFPANEVRGVDDAVVRGAAIAEAAETDSSDMMVVPDTEPQTGKMLDAHKVQKRHGAAPPAPPTGTPGLVSTSSMSTSIGTGVVEDRSLSRSSTSPRRIRWQGGGAKAPDDKMFSSRYSGNGDLDEGDVESGVFTDELVSPSDLGDASAFSAKQGMESATEESSVGMQSSCGSPVSLPEGDPWKSFSGNGSERARCRSPRDLYRSFRPQKHRTQEPRKPQPLKSPVDGQSHELLSPRNSQCVPVLHSPRSAFSPRTPRSSNSSL